MSALSGHVARGAIIVLLGFLLLLPVGALAEQPTAESVATAGYTYHKLTAEEAAQFTSAGVAAPSASEDTGLALPDSEDWGRYVGQLNIVDSVTAPAGAGSVDMTIYNSPSFPIIGNQGSQGSCAAWAATYYSYGYMEAVDQGWTNAKSGDTSQLLSPAWTYNRVRVDGPSGGSWMWDNFFIIRDWGVPTMATMPYNAANDVNWGSEAAWREAPLHRGLGVNVLRYNPATTVADIKALLGQGIPVTFCLNAGVFNTAFTDGNKIISSAEYNRQGLTHAQTVVGYDDSITDDGNVGAFRIANSWGTNWGEGGFYWITYEGMKKIGASPVDADNNVFDNLCLSYISDLPDYAPSTLASWQFDKTSDHCGGSDAVITIAVKEGDVTLAEFQPFLLITTRSATHYFPSFMVVDISNNTAAVLAGASMQISLGAPQKGGALSNLTSFKVEYYGTYSPYPSPHPVLVSRQSSNVPIWQPFSGVSAVLDEFSGADYEVALDIDEKYFGSSGRCAWFGVGGVSHDGSSSLQSGVIGDNSASTLQTYVNGPGEISFWWKVSSETKLTSGDRLIFSVDQVQQLQISGSVDWHMVTFPFGAGEHLISWQYAKDGSTAVGEDAGWVDGITLRQTDDAYEENDNQTSATDVTPGLMADLMGADHDWFRFYMHAGEDATISLAFNNSLGDMNLEVRSTDGRPFYSTSMGNGESISLALLPQDGYVYVFVYGHQGEVNTYSLSIDVTANYSPGADSSMRLDTGTGSYSGVATSNSIGVMPSARLTGELVSTLQSAWPTQDMTVLFVASWWDQASYISYVSSVTEGSSTGVLDMGDFAVPDIPGEYYLIVVFRPAQGGPGYLASSTHFGLSDPVWGDGNDLNSLNASQLSAAEAFGRIPVRFMIGADQYADAYEPAEVIRIHVTDTVDPVTGASTYGSLGSNGWYTSSVSVVLTASDQGTGVATTHVGIDGSSPVPYSTPIGIYAEGVHTLRYWSVDNAGNIEVERTLTVRVDATLPTASMGVQATAFVGHNGYDLGRPTITFSVTDAISGPGEIYYRYADGPWLLYTAPFQYALEVESDLSFKAYDAAGNEGPISVQHLKVDTVAPTVAPTFSGHQGSTTSWFDSAVQVTMPVQELGSGTESIWYSFDGSNYYNYTAPIWVNASGTYHIWARASDVAGNIGAVAMELLLVDVDLPQASLAIEGAQGLDIWWNGSVLIRLSAQDVGSGVATIQYRLDNENEGIYANPFAISGEGRHTLLLWAVDLAGNRMMTMAREIGIDSGAPDSSFGYASPPTEEGWFLAHPVPQIVILDQVSGPGQIFLELDGVAVVYVPGAELALEGSHLLRFRVADAAGNLGPWHESTFRVDTIAPVTALDLSGTLGAGDWYTSNVQATLLPAESVSGLARLEVRWDNGTWTTSNGSIFCASEGKRLLEYRGVDAAGNVESARSVSIWIDKSAPAVQLATPGDDHVTTRSAEVRWIGSDAASGISSVLISVDGGAFLAQAGNAGNVLLENLTDGRHQVVVRLLDGAGNAMELRSTITVDTNPLSPGGPYGPWPILLLLGVVAVVAAGYIFWKRRQ